MGDVKPKKDDPMTRQIKKERKKLEKQIQGKLRVQSTYSVSKLMPLAKDSWHQKELLNKRALLSLQSTWSLI
jgi:hypothetical protein